MSRIAQLDVVQWAILASVVLALLIGIHVLGYELGRRRAIETYRAACVNAEQMYFDEFRLDAAHCDDAVRTIWGKP